MKRTIAISILIVLCSSLCAQTTKTGWLKGDLHVVDNSGCSILIDVKEATAGAVASLITATDTLYTVVTDGTFLFDRIPLGKAWLRISHLGFETYSKEVEILKQTIILIPFKQKVNLLSELTVKGQVPLVTMVGDTLRFNAAAIKYMEGDVALEMLKQAPGVEIDESGAITVLGKNVSRTYVNKRMLFGQDHITALINLPASEVVSIDTYEEATPGGNPLDKRRVLNIRTRNPIVKAVTGHAVASGGHDFDPAGRGRYFLGLTGNLFSEELLLSANAFSNNTGQRTNLLNAVGAAYMVNNRYVKQNYTEQCYANVKAEKTWGTNGWEDIIRLQGRYTYEKSDILAEMINRNAYLPSPDYVSREYADSTRNAVRSDTHEANLGLIINKRKIMVSFDNSFRTSVSVAENNRFGMNTLNGNVIRNQSQYQTRGDDYLLRQDLLGTVVREKISYQFRAKHNLGYGDGEAFRIDSFASTDVKKIVETGPSGPNRKITAGGSVSLHNYNNENGNHILNVGYTFEYENSRRQRFALDISDASKPLTDTVNTFDYTRDYRAHNIQVSYLRQFSQARIQVHAETTFRSSEVNRREEFPEADNFHRPQQALLPKLSLSKNWDGQSHSDITYETSVEMPSIEQWRNQLNNLNPYLLVAGNPELKQSYHHNIYFSHYFFGKTGNDLTFSATLTFRQNVIAERTTYFKQATLLPAWNVVAPAQSSLTEYVNLNGNRNFLSFLSYTWMLKAIKCKISATTQFNYNRDPSYIQGRLTQTDSYSPSGGLSLNSNFSRAFRISISNNTGYTYSSNSAGQDNRLLRVFVGTTTQWNPSKQLYFKTVYNLSHFHDYTGRIDDNTTHILQAIAGYRFKNGLNISLSGYDLLNGNTGFKTMMTQDYIRTTRSLAFGRYFTFNLAYQFSNLKSGLTKPNYLNLEDGNVRPSMP